jgi:uncharacterized protein (DUF1800 family)
MFEQSIAVNRFGLGAKRSDDAPADPAVWLRQQMMRFDPTPAAFSNLPGRAEIAVTLADYIEEARGLKRKNGRDQKPETDTDPAKAARKLMRQDAQSQYRAQVGARARAAIQSDTPFVERLVHFWANHFAISADKLTTIGIGGMLEIEAIRPHVLGKFGDMLLAVEQHPAMLLYLDQAQSIGPNSLIGSRMAGRRGPNGKAPGLNENLAREILELHTLGVRTGYTQADVTEFARALTGWTVAGITRGPAARIIADRVAPGTFVFVEQLHEPGTRALIGRGYEQRGEAQARAILAELSVSPATATHVATKLARHFASDDPPPALVDTLKAAFLKSGGDLPTVYGALIAAPEVWAKPATKFKSPWEWMISSLRALEEDSLPDQMIANTLSELGQPTWRPGSPAGFDDIAQSWAGPDALVKRVDVAERLATRIGLGIDARTMASKLLLGTLSPATTQVIARADSPAQALALLLVSPEFLRR